MGGARARARLLPRVAGAVHRLATRDGGEPPVRVRVIRVGIRVRVRVRVRFS